MSEYCHRKVIRMKISEEEVCKIFGVDDGWGVSDLLEKTEFEIDPTSDFFLDYVLSSRNDAEGDWGRTRRLSNAEYVKYGSKFRKLLKRRIVMPNELRFVEYCWCDCSEAPDYFDESTYHDDFYDDDMDLIDDMPAANVQSVKHGRWDGYICSECNVCADYFISGDFYFDEKPNFCPNCGAKMDLEDGDTNG